MITLVKTENKTTPTPIIFPDMPFSFVCHTINAANGDKNANTVQYFMTFQFIYQIVRFFVSVAVI